MEPKLFYRVGNIETHQGLWYNQQGEFTGLIHNEYQFCKHRELRMDYDPFIAGYLSATLTLEELQGWFPLEDMERLVQHSFFVHEYSATDYKFYEQFGHWLINQDTSQLIRVIEAEVAV